MKYDLFQNGTFKEIWFLHLNIYSVYTRVHVVDYLDVQEEINKFPICVYYSATWQH